MKKIISLFQRNYETDRLVRDEVVPGAEWVLAGEGVATRKLDGACCMVRGGKLFKRYELKNGKVAPVGFEAAQEPDPVTGHIPGWVPVGNGPEDKWFREAYRRSCMPEEEMDDGTYEAIGPHFQGNPEKLEWDMLMLHGKVKLEEAPRTFAEIKKYLQAMFIEGIVWHHPDGRMVKIKARDFGIKRGEAPTTSVVPPTNKETVMSSNEVTTAAQEPTGAEASTTTSAPSEQAGSQSNENQAQETGSGESNEAARTGAQQVSGGTAAPASPNPPLDYGTPSRRLGEYVIYVAGPEDEGHGGIIPGEKLAAIVVMEGPFPNLKVFCSTTDATLLKKCVPFGNDPGQWHF